MRLTRLQTEDNNCIFDIFNTDIIIEPNAKIAFQNVAVVKNVAKVENTTDNHTLTYPMNQTTAPTQTVQLELGEYSKNNYLSLFTDMTDKLNKSLRL